MTNEQCQKMLDIIVGVYPSFLNGRDPKIVFRAWYRYLKDSDYEDTMKNLDKWIEENTYPPTIRDIKPWSPYAGLGKQ